MGDDRSRASSVDLQGFWEGLRLRFSARLDLQQYRAGLVFIWGCLGIGLALYLRPGGAPG